MAATLVVTLSTYAGIDLRGELLTINPHLPKAWDEIKFNTQYRGTRFHFTMDHQRIVITSDQSTEIQVKNQRIALTANQPTTIEYQDGAPMKGLVFDLDGVITDTAKFHYIAWKNMADSLGIEIDEKFNEQLKGISRIESLEKILAYGGKADLYNQQQKLALADEKNREYVELLEQLTPGDILPGILSLLDQADALGIQCAIASASRNAPHILEKLGIKERFAHIVDPQTLTHGKPHPEIFIRAAEAIGITPQQAIGFEDAQAGIEGIKGAGMFAVGVAVDEPLQGADILVDTLAGLQLSDLMRR
ncbi:beta-phosphoglucomutase [Dongshaea marina]|uniref:beta-phosphoglucomutase n=1 Tax=Dongshaea marina TaxID=2047966 RepID=UPI000D3EC204|nr:beta-phosphoglucomutase [Dongshaea marina]